jgi:hypothetical protein
VASSLLIVAQRLARRVCEASTEWLEIARDVLAAHGYPPTCRAEGATTVDELPRDPRLRPFDRPHGGGHADPGPGESGTMGSRHLSDSPPGKEKTDDPARPKDRG